MDPFFFLKTSVCFVVLKTPLAFKMVYNSIKYNEVANNTNEVVTLYK